MTCAIASPSPGRVVRLSPMGGCGLVAIFALSLVAFGFLDGVRQNPEFQWSFFGPGALLLAWSGLVFGWAQHTGRILTLAIALRKQHFVQAIAQGVFLLYWGVALAPGLRLGLSHRRPAGLRLRIRHAALLVTTGYLQVGVRSVPRHLQHQPVSLVCGRLVLPAVSAGGARLRGQGADPVGQGRTARPHLQSFVVSARGLLARPDSHRDERPHMGPGHRDRTVLSPPCVPGPVSGWAARAVPLRRGVDDDVRRGGHLRVRGSSTLPQPAPISSTIRTSRLPCSSACTSCSQIRPRRRGPRWAASCSACSTA